MAKPSPGVWTFVSQENLNANGVGSYQPWASQNGLPPAKQSSGVMTGFARLHGQTCQQLRL